LGDTVSVTSGKVKGAVRMSAARINQTRIT
jgi:hypothetical protein